MKVKVTVYLKTGGELVSIFFDESSQSIKERCSKTFVKKSFLSIDDGKIIQIVPTDNIALIQIEEVAE